MQIMNPSSQTIKYKTHISFSFFFFFCKSTFFILFMRAIRSSKIVFFLEIYFCTHNALLAFSYKIENGQRNVQLYFASNLYFFILRHLIFTQYHIYMRLKLIFVRCQNIKQKYLIFTKLKKPHVTRFLFLIFFFIIFHS